MSTKKALVTGVSGQDGSYLSEYLLDLGYEVHGMIRAVATPTHGNISHLLDHSDFYLHYGDLTDTVSINSLVEDVQPDEIYNLAAQSHVGKSFKLPEQTSDATAIGTLRLLEAIRKIKPDTKFYQASTSELYGDTEITPQNELTPFNPTSPYAVSKLYAYHMVETYKHAYNIFACNGILFNHESPRRGQDFVTQKIITHMTQVFKREREHVELGNLNAKRDWGYAGDYVKAMHKMLQQKDPQNFVIATGRQHTIRDFCNFTAEHLGYELEWQGKGINEQGIDKKTGKTVVKVNPKWYRPADVNNLCGEPKKAKEVLDWEPETTLEQLIKIMLEHQLN